MDISVRKQSDVNVIKLRGSLRLGAPVDELKALLDQILEANESRVILNVAEVPMIDSSAIGLLVRVLASVKQLGGSVKLVQPSEMVVRTLKIVGMSNLFETFDSDETAVESFG